MIDQDFSLAPNWAKFTAMDDDGVWYLYENKPVYLPSFGKWFDLNKGQSIKVVYNELSAKNSLTSLKNCEWKSNESKN